jgi:S1-C subfamily serine protease
MHLLCPMDLGEERWRAQRKGSMRLGTKVLSLGCAGLAVALMPTPGQAQSDPASLTAVAVHINRTPKQSWPGYGIYLGNGLILTAAHVAGDVAQTKPHVVIAGQDLPASLVKQGSLEGVDLTLLSIDGTKLPIGLQMRRTPLCDHPSFAGERVVVAIPEGTAPSKIVPPQAIPADLRGRFDTAIADVATTGNSGSGVFDAANLCLLGIMSRKISVSSAPFKVGAPARTIDIAQYFVPAAQIKAFIPKTASF